MPGVATRRCCADDSSSAAAERSGAGKIELNTLFEGRLVDFERLILAPQPGHLIGGGLAPFLIDCARLIQSLPLVQSVRAECTLIRRVVISVSFTACAGVADPALGLELSAVCTIRRVVLLSCWTTRGRRPAVDDARRREGLVGLGRGGGGRGGGEGQQALVLGESASKSASLDDELVVLARGAVQLEARARGVHGGEVGELRFEAGDFGVRFFELRVSMCLGDACNTSQHKSLVG